MTFEITLWGVRGSLPTPYLPSALEQRIVDLGEAFTQAQATKSFNSTSTSTSSSPSPNLYHFGTFLKELPLQKKGGYGGNTTCVQVKTPGTNLILDGGTGIRHTIADCLNPASQKDQREIHLFFTHFHWDHIIGLPFFPAFYIPGNIIHLYAVQPELERVMRTLFQKPFFPVPYEALGAKIVYHQLRPREKYQLNDLTMTPYLLDHPDPCWGLRVEYQNKAYAHCVDTEAIRVEREELGEDLPLYQNADLMVFDAQYSIEEAKEKRNWGHSSAPRGLEIAGREKIKKVVFVHHDPMVNDEHISQIALEAVKYFESSHQGEKISVDWEIGYEGMKIEL